MRRTPTRRQRPIQGGRAHKSAGFDPLVLKAVEKEAARFNVSVPFVLSVMAADCLGVELEEKDRYTPDDYAGEGLVRPRAHRRLRLVASGR